MQTIQKVLSVLERKERIRLFAIFLLTSCVACLEALGIASVLPFLTVLSSPDTIQTNPVLARLHEFMGMKENSSFLLQLGVVVFFVVLATNILTATSQWFIHHFTWRQNHSISVRLLQSYMSQPWETFVLQNTSALSTKILSEVQTFVSQFLISGLQLFAHGIASLTILLLLFAFDPVLAMVITAILGGTYACIFMLVKKKQSDLGLERKLANSERFRAASDALKGLKQIRMRNQEKVFVQRYKDFSSVYNSSQATNAVISVFPRYVLEVLAFGAVILILAWETDPAQNADLLPLIGIYGFAGFRLLPKMQAIFYAASSMRFTNTILDSIVEDLNETKLLQQADDAETVDFEKEFVLDQISFTYPSMDRPTLDDVSIEIPYLSCIGIVGPTGSGKSTLMDIMLGLLTPSGGRLKVDNQALGPHNINHWRAQCGYVPQSVFLSDDSLATNVAFGVSPSEVDIEAVHSALRMARLDDFVATLPKGIDTIIGEAGARLSGGQRQRIGIARALYFDPPILFFDEATSALDHSTESAIMDAIDSLSGSKTIVIIAHRLTTLRDCDCIYVVENGQIVDAGTWDELVQSNDTFSHMVTSDSD